MKKITMLVLFLIGLAAVAMAQSVKNPYLTKEKIPVIFDTDMGNDIDDTLALAMLMMYLDDERIDLLAIMNNKDSEYSLKYLDMLTSWFGYDQIPLGKIRDGAKLNDYVDYAKNMVEMNEEGKIIYKYRRNPSAHLDAHILYRKVLADQPDNSVVVISVGFLTNLHRLLETPADEYSPLTGKELVAKKVKYLSVMGGSFGPKKRAEFNIVNDIPAARHVFEHWPVGIVLSPFEVGATVQYPALSIENDFNWTAHHPVVDAYKRYRPFPYNRATWDLTSVFFAVEGDKELLNLSIPGKISVDEKGFTSFQDAADGKHYYLTINKNQIGKLKDYFIIIVARHPKAFVEQ